jgi:hypothetical protein
VSGDDFLSRWSRRKHAARKGGQQEEELPAKATSRPDAGSAAAPTPSGQPAEPPLPPAEPPLPPVESLTHDSDFTPFMRPGVDPALKRQAMRTLMRDPRFNVMDGLDVYIDDYSKPDPIPADWLGKLNQMARLGDYRPPESDAQSSASAPQDETQAENPMTEQKVADGGDAPPSDTSAIDSTPTGLKES